MTTRVKAQLLELAKSKSAGNDSLQRLLVAAISAADADDLERQNGDALIAALTTSHERLTATPQGATQIGRAHV